MLDKSAVAMDDQPKGYVQVYTGNGRGKTTAAFGLAIRALGAGLSVYIGQFVKDIPYHETRLQELFEPDRLLIRQLGNGCFINKDPDHTDLQAAKQALNHVEKIMSSGAYDLVILDELTIACHYSLIDIEAVLSALEKRAPGVEVIITGRYAPKELIDYADLVTEMEEVKHYYSTHGTLSRPGFDC